MWICPICQLTCNIMQNPPKKLLAEISDRLHCDLDQPCYLSPTGLLGYCLCAGNNDRKASFTDVAVGKAAAMSGSSSTKLVPARYLSTYLPLTPPTIWEKSYSGRSSSNSSVFFFIKPLLLASGSSSTNDSNTVVSVCVGNN